MKYLVYLSIIIAPIGCNMSINSLFGTKIPYTFETWFAAFFLGLVIRFLIASVVNINEAPIIIEKKDDELPKTET